MKLAHLVPAAALLIAAPASAACPSEGDYPNQVVIQQGDLRFVFGTDAAYYDGGTPVQMYIGAENTGSADAVIANPGGISPLDAWVVMPGTCAAPAGACWDDRVFYSPVVVYFFGTTVTVAPGECHERFMTWGGLIEPETHPDVGSIPDPGTYTVMGGYFSGYPPQFHAPAGGAGVTITIGEPVPAEPTTWSRIRRARGLTRPGS